MKERLSLEDRIALCRYRADAARERLKAAEVLLKEGLYRDSITRAYYAIHSMARALLILYDIRATTHEGVKAMLSKQLIKEAKLLPADFAKKFSILKALREDADYEDFIEFSRKDAEEAIEMAKEFIDRTSQVVEEIIKSLK
ncbi:MAG: HEPN domain-containing protein [Nitrospirae bacterium]|nr:MAG: HEPN domain-containing protein [Nitrospirota bacterium]